ncbi:MAG TPA: acyl-CoA carboxylase subunit epsilon [Thermomicrobiales bacterium]|nr:acyl-CoA carboxylase subunit epsilon [Thermomicrobiales bacterium]
MSGNAHRDTGILIRVMPEPTPEELAAIVAVLRARRRRQQTMATTEELSHSVSRWARAGREEAMAAWDFGDGKGTGSW